MNERIRIAKMSGAGNDFIVVDATKPGLETEALRSWIGKICTRRLSLGADGVLLVSRTGDDRVRVRYHNRDGSETFCGNGTRCAARYARELGWAGSRMLLDTVAGPVEAVVGRERVRLTLPPPSDRGEVEIAVPDAEPLRGRWIEAGVPHFVIFSSDPSRAPLAEWGPAARSHEHFGGPGVNVDIVGRDSDGILVVRTWERGVEGETLACGSGAIAAAFAARLDSGPACVTVRPASGVPLEVELPGEAARPQQAILSGDARIVLWGDLTPEAVCGF